MKKIALTSLILALGAGTAAADVSGDWKIEGTIGQMQVALVCSLKEADAKLTGSCKSEMFPELPVTGTASADKASWNYTVDYQGQQFAVQYDGTLASDKEMKGDISVGGQSQGQFTAAKQ